MASPSSPCPRSRILQRKLFPPVGCEPMRRALIIRLDAPLISFGGVMVDNRGVAAPFPALSMVTGLLANALGCDRCERARLQRLQDRLVLASRIESERYPLLTRDFQTAKLEADDKGWTTRGSVEGRAGGADTYKSPHIRLRDYWADAAATLAVMLDPADEAPSLNDVAEALRFPARPLFFGRKPCLPAGPVVDLDPFVEADDVRDALELTPPVRAVRPPPREIRRLRIQWPAQRGAPTPAGARLERVSDERNWAAGPHGGERRVFVEDRR